MNDEIKNILNKIIETGYQAYVVGGYVRDYLLGIESFDVDIATNA
ncbi:MAG: CCA tRNA nucleotidyltransferase, partial [Bacilli bacterium]|nr:CCA tRNA nucleotidyltransferase [Bacilli bacterium]